MSTKINKNGFRYLVLAQIISDLGNWFYTAALSAMVYIITQSSLALSFTLIFSLLPSAIFSFVGGGISDRFNAKKTLILMDAVRAVSILFVLFFKSSDTLYIVYVVAFMNSICGALHTISKNVIIQKLFKGVELRKVISRLRMYYELTVIFGSMCGGMILAYLGFYTVVIVNSASFVVAMIFVLLIRYNNKTSVVVEKEEKISFINLQKEGFKYIFSNGTLKEIALYKMFYTVAGGILNILPAIIALGRFNYGEEGTGFIFASIGVGSIIGAWLNGIIKTKEYSNKYMAYGAIVFVFGFIILMLAPNFYVALVATGIVGGVSIFLQTYTEGSYMVLVDEAFVGRVSGTFLFITYGGITISLGILGAVLKEHFMLTLFICIIIILIPNILNLLIKAYSRKNDKEYIFEK
ncbi:sugar transporter [Vallitalea longa]|uniref:Sugar transporter n=1 Tax=Vallitalea longa TaxID=2936439 RepID=A0A9W5Y8V3_9FIRM|nr:MFS transporter [Vallitalea longa]GKX28016.1 sugar transporter [Vallitalea longa]